MDGRHCQLKIVTMNPMSATSHERPGENKRENNSRNFKSEKKEFEREFDQDMAPVFGGSDANLTKIVDETARENKARELIEALHNADTKTKLNLLKIALKQNQNSSDEISKAVRRALIRLLRGITRKVIERATDSKKQALLEKLATLEITDREAAYLYEFIEKYFSDDSKTIEINATGNRSEFESDILNIKQEAPDIFHTLVSILTDIKQDIGLSNEAIEKLVNYANEPPIRHRLGEMDPARKEEFLRILNKIEGAFVDTPEDRKAKALVMNYIMTPDPDALAQWEKTKPEELKTSVMGILQSRHIVTAENFSNFYNLAREYRDTGELGRYLESYSNEDVQQGIQQFDEQTVFQKLFIKRVNADGTEMFVWNEQNTKFFERAAQRMINGLFEKIDENPNAEFREQFNDLIEGQVMRAIADRFFQLSNSEFIKKKLSNNPKEYEAFNNFLRRRLVFQMHLERNHRELYHNIVNIFTAVPAEKWAGYLSRIPISELSNLTKDPVINEALELWKTYLQERLMRNDNKIPPDLLGGGIQRRDEKGDLLREHEQIYSFTERDDFVKRLRDQIFISTGRMPEQWELDRAYSLAKGMTALTMEMSGVLSNAKVTESYESIPLADIISKHNPRFLWGWGRGGRPELMKTSALYMIKMRLMTKQGSFKQVLQEGWRDRWIPEEIVRLGNQFEKQVEDLDTTDPAKFHEMIDRFSQYIFDHDTTWAKLIQKVSMGDWLSQGGWRIYGVKEVWKEFHQGEEWGKEKWGDIYDFFYKQMGVTLGFAFAESRANEESLLALANIPDNLKKLNTPEAKYEFIENMRRKLLTDLGDQTDIGRDEREKEKIECLLNGVKRTISFHEFQEHRVDAIRGDTFYHLLLKDPLAFLNNLGQIIPFLQDGQIDGEDAGKFFFDHASQSDIKTGAGQDKFGRFHNYFLERFATTSQEANKESQQMLRNIMDFYTHLYKEMKVYDAPTEKKDRYRNQARDLLFKYLSTAHAKAAKVEIDIQAGKIKNLSRTPGEIDPRDIISDEEYNRFLTTPYDPEKPEDEHNQKAAAAKIRKLLFEDGLISRFKDHVNSNAGYFGEVKDGKADLGYTNGFFQRLAFTWWRRNNISVIPNGDLNHDLLFRAVHKSGEDQFFRTYGAMDTLGKVQTEVMKLYSRLKRASVKENAGMFDVLEDVLKAHSQIKELEPFIGQQPMREIQYYYSVVVARYFQENWIKRMPFPVSAIARPLILGNSTSMSKLLYRHRAPEFSSDQLREYARWLRKEGCLNSYGLYSYEMFLKELGVDDKRFWLTEMGPNLAIYFTMFILFEYIKEAFEEEVQEENKKK